MAVSLQRARDFIYQNGVLWERAAFAHLFEGGSLDRLHQCLLCYKNPDNGFGHALEHDIRTPESHPLALEFLLVALVRVLDIPTGPLLDGSAGWLAAQQQGDGTLRNPPSVLAYPHAPWWNEGGQHIPVSMAGNLAKLGLLGGSLAEKTRTYVQKRYTPEKIAGNEWLFMAYHPLDYFFNVDDFPDLDAHRRATLDNIRACAEAMPEEQYSSLLQLAPSPQSPVAQAMPDLVARSLDHVMATQREDGGWPDQHNLPQWMPFTTLVNLRILRNHGRALDD